MTAEIHLSRVESALDDHAYPADRGALAESFAGTTVLLADGEADLGALLSETGERRFETAEDAFVALQNVLPIEAVGEPGQSDGDA
jgi:hypothetical protein